jgi:hypothetical protein
MANCVSDLWLSAFSQVAKARGSCAAFEGPVNPRDELLRAVVAAPNANGPSEVFAAWGIAHGDPQGELARVQLDEARERCVGISYVSAGRARSLKERMRRPQR